MCLLNLEKAKVIAIWIFLSLDVFVEYKSDRVMLIVQSLVVFGEGKSDSNVDFPVIGCVC